MRAKEVVLHIYDVTNNESDKANNTIVHINKIFKDRIGLGGIFHSAIQIYGDEEWSFGYCEREGSGVLCCPARKNPLYTYRECIVLGNTELSFYSVNNILRELSREWPGQSYDLLKRNCNHFCDELCERLGMPKLPAWVNRFANAGDKATEIAGNTAMRLQGAKTEILSVSKTAYRFLLGAASNSTAVVDSNTNTDTSNSKSTWLSSIVPICSATSSTTNADLKKNEEARSKEQKSKNEVKSTSKDSSVDACNT